MRTPALMSFSYVGSMELNRSKREYSTRGEQSDQAYPSVVLAWIAVCTSLRLRYFVTCQPEPGKRTNVQTTAFGHDRHCTPCSQTYRVADAWVKTNAATVATV